MKMCSDDVIESVWIVVLFNCVVPKSCLLVHGKENDSICSTEPLVDSEFSDKVLLYEFDG